MPHCAQRSRTCSQSNARHIDTLHSEAIGSPKIAQTKNYKK